MVLLMVFYPEITAVVIQSISTIVREGIHPHHWIYIFIHVMWRDNDNHSSIKEMH